MRLVVCAALIASVACDPTGPADYSPAAVVQGYVRDGQGQPLAGLSIEVSLLKASCTDDPTPTVSDPDAVVTDVDGYFSGTFETLGAGPISVTCLIIRAVEDGGPSAQILVDDRTKWTSPPQDTVVVELTA